MIHFDATGESYSSFLQYYRLVGPGLQIFPFAFQFYNMTCKYRQKKFFLREEAYNKSQSWLRLCQTFNINIIMIIYFLGFKSLQRSLSRHPFPPPFSIAFDYLTKSHLSLSGVTKEIFFPHRIKTF